MIIEFRFKMITIFAPKMTTMDFKFVYAPWQPESMPSQVKLMNPSHEKYPQ